ncbi:MAG: hypothetical protein ACI9CE_002156 [Flavobacterium sp.]
MIKLLRQLSIRQRLWLIIALALLSSAILTGLSFSYTKLLFTESEKLSTHTQAQMAKKIVSNYYQKSVNGSMTRPEAKN